VTASLLRSQRAMSSYPGLAELAGKIGLSQAMLAPPDAPTVTLSEADAADYAGRVGWVGAAYAYSPRRRLLTANRDGAPATGRAVAMR
jgi:hypothetical protein